MPKGFSFIVFILNAGLSFFLFYIMAGQHSRDEHILKEKEKKLFENEANEALTTHKRKSMS